VHLVVAYYILHIVYQYILYHLIIIIIYYIYLIFRYYYEGSLTMVGYIVCTNTRSRAVCDVYYNTNGVEIDFVITGIFICFIADM
jgi:hypothetical protein